MTIYGIAPNAVRIDFWFVLEVEKTTRAMAVRTYPFLRRKDAYHAMCNRMSNILLTRHGDVSSEFQAMFSNPDLERQLIVKFAEVVGHVFWFTIEQQHLMIA